MKNENSAMAELNKATIDRIKNAVSAGIKIKTIADSSGITYFRIASVVNTSAYRYSTSFSLAEMKRIHKAFDAIRDAL